MGIIHQVCHLLQQHHSFANFMKIQLNIKNKHTRLFRFSLTILQYFLQYFLIRFELCVCSGYKIFLSSPSDLSPRVVSIFNSLLFILFSFIYRKVLRKTFQFIKKDIWNKTVNSVHMFSMSRVSLKNFLSEMCNILRFILKSSLDNAKLFNLRIMHLSREYHPYN